MATRNDLRRYAITDVPGARLGEQGYHPDGLQTAAEFAGAPYAGTAGPHGHFDEPLASPRRARTLDASEGDDYATPGSARYGDPQARTELVRASQAGRGPRDYRRSDARIREDVCERLTEDAYVDAREIDVAVADGEVTLTGSVPTRTMKRAVDDVIDRCRGVRDVHNRLTVDDGLERRAVNPPRPHDDGA